MSCAMPHSTSPNPVTHPCASHPFCPCAPVLVQIPVPPTILPCPHFSVSYSQIPCPQAGGRSPSTVPLSLCPSSSHPCPHPQGKALLHCALSSHYAISPASVPTSLCPFSQALCYVPVFMSLCRPPIVTMSLSPLPHPQAHPPSPTPSTPCSPHPRCPHLHTCRHPWNPSSTVPLSPSSPPRLSVRSRNPCSSPGTSPTAWGAQRPPWVPWGATGGATVARGDHQSGCPPMPQSPHTWWRP